MLDNVEEARGASCCCRSNAKGCKPSRELLTRPLAQRKVERPLILGHTRPVLHSDESVALLMMETIVPNESWQSSAIKDSFTVTNP